MDVALWIRQKCIVFMSMYNDIDWTAKDNASICDQNSSEVSEYAAKFPVGHWTVLCLGSEKMIRDALIQTRRGLDSNGTKNDAELRGVRAEPDSAELSFRTVQAVNQLNFYGAVAHWCSRQDVKVTQSSAEAQSQLVPHDFVSYLIKHETGDTSTRGNSLQSRFGLIANLSKAARLATVFEDAGFVRSCLEDQFFMSGLELDEFVNSNVSSTFQMYVVNTHPRDYLAPYLRRSIGVNARFGPSFCHQCARHARGRDRHLFHANNGMKS